MSKIYRTERARKISATKLAKPVTNDAAGRKRANTYLYPAIEPCAKCGTTNKIDRHHIDGNPKNNERNNIQFLCKLHHQRLHQNWKKRKIIADEERFCEYCNKAFITKRWTDHRFCSKSCSAKFNKNWLLRKNML